MDPMPTVSVKFRSSRPGTAPIERSELSPVPDGPGKAVYSVPKGPVAGVAEVIVQWTALGAAQERAAQGRTAQERAAQERAAQGRTTKELGAGLQGEWGGWASLDEK
jgi:hypothetical protein